MKVTLEVIKSYNPCDNGYTTFANKYPYYNDTLEALLKLKDVSYSDKIWLVCKMLDKNTLVQWSLDCAEFVFENSDDDRVRFCLDEVSKHLNNEPCDLSAAWSAVWSAARSAESAAESAARSAESAARSAARSAAWSAVWSAARSAAWSAVWSAAWSAESEARLEQEDINLSLLIALVSNLEEPCI